ncbi:TonB-dependent receptor family protein [Cellvibrio mixtus]|uniref:TonB-dependent receptor family protein n=1 Tax=Cellvibrio mixtus TaxID=39650 RepID=UPI000AB7CCC6|nr:TonB-dependent receptor [Cellvibrio mixtus]
MKPFYAMTPCYATKFSSLLPLGCTLVIATSYADTSHVSRAEKSLATVETLVVYGSQPGPLDLARQSIANTPTDFGTGARLDPAELLVAIPGVQVDFRTNYAQDTRISLRGFGARSAFGVRGIDLLVDGIPMSTPDGQGQLSSVMLDSVTAVQVLRGPLASLYGNGAGGVIAVQTATPQQNQFVLGGVGSDQGLERYQVQGDFRHSNFAVRGQFADTRLEGDRPHSAAEREQAAVQMFYTTSNNLDVRIKHEQSDDPLLEDPLGLTPEQWRADPWQKNPLAETYNTRKSVKHHQTSISVREQQGDTRWQTAVWQGERDITQYLGFIGDGISGSGGVVDLARDFAGASATVTHSTQLLSMPIDLSLGAEAAKMEDRRRGYVNNLGVAGDLRRDELGEASGRDIYTLLQLNPVQPLTLYAGARRSWLDIDVEDYFIVAGNPDDSGARAYREHSYALGGNYQFANHWEIFASSGRGYETPTLTEMAYKAGATGLNTQLDAAINHQYQWGVQYQHQDQLQFSITHFIINTDNEIVVDQSVGGRTSFRNAAETEREGVEIFARVALNDMWKLQASAQSMRADYSAGPWDGKQLPGVAREQYQLGVEWLPLRNDLLQVNLITQQRSRIFTADNNQVAAPGFYTLDFSLQGEYEMQSWGLDWWLKLANLRDENYVGSVVVNQSNGRAFEPALGRNFSGGVKIAYRF